MIPLWRLLRRGSPLPIPNREVKPACADGTWPKARESKTMPILEENPHSNVGIFFKIGIDILSRALDQVPSAQVGLTSLFGMGRGDPHRNRRHKGIVRG